MLPKLTDEERAVKVGRALFATTGLRKVLVPGDMDITKDDYAKAVKFEPSIHEIVRRFLADEKEDTKLPPYDHDDVVKLLSATMDDDQLAMKQARFAGSPVADDFFLAASNARQFLKTKLPARFRATWVGRLPVQPSKSELMTWRWYLETVGDPLWALRNMLMATLNSKHVEALAQVWPDVLQTARIAVTKEIGRRLEKEPDLRLSRRQVRQLAVLTENDPTTPPELRDALQASFTAQPQGEKPTPPKSAAPEDLKTPTQKVSDR